MERTTETIRVSGSWGVLTVDLMWDGVNATKHNPAGLVVRWEYRRQGVSPTDKPDETGTACPTCGTTHPALAPLIDAALSVTHDLARRYGGLHRANVGPGNGATGEGETEAQGVDAEDETADLMKKGLGKALDSHRGVDPDDNAAFTAAFEELCENLFKVNHIVEVVDDSERAIPRRAKELSETVRFFAYEAWSALRDLSAHLGPRFCMHMEDWERATVGLIDDDEKATP